MFVYLSKLWLLVPVLSFGVSQEVVPMGELPRAGLTGVLLDAQVDGVDVVFEVSFRGEGFSTGATLVGSKAQVHGLHMKLEAPLRSQALST